MIPFLTPLGVHVVVHHPPVLPLVDTACSRRLRRPVPCSSVTRRTWHFPRSSPANIPSPVDPTALGNGRGTRSLPNVAYTPHAYCLNVALHSTPLGSPLPLPPAAYRLVSPLATRPSVNICERPVSNHHRVVKEETQAIRQGCTFAVVWTVTYREEYELPGVYVPSSGTTRHRIMLKKSIALHSDTVWLLP